MGALLREHRAPGFGGIWNLPTLTLRTKQKRPDSTGRIEQRKTQVLKLPPPPVFGSVARFSHPPPVLGSVALFLQDPRWFSGCRLPRGVLGSPSRGPLCKHMGTDSKFI